MAHIHEKIDFCASVFIVNGDAVLLHKHRKYDKWLQVGGHIELNEGPIEAVLREAKEESGLDVTLVGKAEQIVGTKTGFSNLILPSFLNRHIADESTGHEHIDFIYFATASTREVNPRDGETKDVRWFTKEDLNNPDYGFWASTQYYAKTALEELGS